MVSKQRKFGIEVSDRHINRLLGDGALHSTIQTAEK